METIRTVIIDDEPDSVQLMRLNLKNIFRNLKSLAVSTAALKRRSNWQRFSPIWFF